MVPIGLKSRLFSTMRCFPTSFRECPLTLHSPAFSFVKKAMDREQSSKDERNKQHLGVKKLVDDHGGLLEDIPDEYIHPALSFSLHPLSKELSVPVISLKDFDNNIDSRNFILQEICMACQEWGFFQLTDHGIPLASLQNTVDSALKLNELQHQQKMEYHGDFEDFAKSPIFYEPSSCLRKEGPLNWADKFYIPHESLHDHMELLPECIRDPLTKHVEKVTQVTKKVMEGLGEVMGISTSAAMDGEKDIGQIMWERCICMSRVGIVYYPPCPKPEMTMGIHPHSDSFTLTVLIGNDVEGLQVLHNDMWVPVNPLPGSLTVNVGDILELLSNGRFKSVKHRVVTNAKATRVSVGCFFHQNWSDSFAPIPQLVDEKNPPVYRETSLEEYSQVFLSGAVKRKSTLEYFKISK